MLDFFHPYAVNERLKQNGILHNCYANFYRSHVILFNFNIKKSCEKQRKIISMGNENGDIKMINGTFISSFEIAFESFNNSRLYA